LSTVDWNKIWAQWTCSEGVQKIEDQTKISDLVALMEHCLESCKSSVVNTMSIRAKECMEKENLTKWTVLEIASQQLALHRQVWETHLDQPDNLTVEYPIAIQKPEEIRYFKMQIMQGNKLLKQPKSIKHVTINYHEPTKTIQVTYV
jgi:hypothetical protein